MSTRRRRPVSLGAKAASGSVIEGADRRIGSVRAPGLRPPRAARAGGREPPQDRRVSSYGSWPHLARQSARRSAPPGVFATTCVTNTPGASTLDTPRRSSPGRACPRAPGARPGADSTPPPHLPSVTERSAGRPAAAPSISRQTRPQPSLATPHRGQRPTFVTRAPLPLPTQPERPDVGATATPRRPPSERGTRFGHRGSRRADRVGSGAWLAAAARGTRGRPRTTAGSPRVELWVVAAPNSTVGAKVRTAGGGCHHLRGKHPRRPTLRRARRSSPARACPRAAGRQTRRRIDPTASPPLGDAVRAVRAQETSLKPPHNVRTLATTCGSRDHRALPPRAQVERPPSRPLLTLRLDAHRIPECCIFSSDPGCCAAAPTPPSTTPAPAARTPAADRRSSRP